MHLPPFERLLEDHGGVVLRVCRALLGPTDAEDAWSETFLAALEGYPELRDRTNLRGWLVTIAHRKAVDHIRRAGRSSPSDRLPDAATLDRYPADGDTALWRALAALPEKQRRAVIFHHIAGLPYIEIGRILGSSPAAARRAASDGIAGLRRAFPHEEAS